MKKIAALIVLLIAVLVGVVYAAGSLIESPAVFAGQTVKKITLTWTGDAANGTVPATVVTPLNGYLLRVVTRPHVNSTIQPEDNYDLTLTEHTNGSLDLFNGMGMNRDTANAEQFMPHHNNGTINVYPVFSAAPLTLTHTNSSVVLATGAIDLYVEVSK